MSINRTYQGRITAAHWVTDKKHERTGTLSEEQWNKIISNHLCIHHSAINYYLCCFAACAKGSEIKALENLYLRVKDSWKEHSYRFGGKGPGFRESLSSHLPDLIKSDTSFDDACNILIDRVEGSDKKLQLALEALLTDLGGESSIQQGGRSYLPNFCNPNSKANFPRNALILQRKQAKNDLPRILHSADPTAPQKIRSEYKLHHFANLSKDAEPYKGEIVVKKLTEYLAHLLSEKIINPTQHDSWLKEINDLDTSELTLDHFNGASAKGAEKNRLYAYLLFKFLPPNDERFLCLRDTFPEPKEEKKEVDPDKKLSENQQEKLKKKEEIEAKEKRLSSLGDDPISMARGERGYVFKSFTRQFAATDEDFAPTWIEFDISAFKQALLTLNQIEQKTEERLKQLAEIESHISFYEKGTGSPYDPDEPVTFKDDPRFEKWSALRDKLIERSDNEFGYGVRWGTIKGWDQLKPRYQYHLVNHPNATHSELVENILVPFQKKNKNIGSVLLFNILADPQYHSYWHELDEQEVIQWNKNQWSHNILRDLIQYEELRTQRDDLKENLHIKLTPAHVKRSRRPIMLSDLGGASKVIYPNIKNDDLRKNDKTPSLITTVYCEESDTQTYTPKRIEFSYSAPRLIRDNLTGAENRNLLQPLLKGLGLKQPEVKKISAKPHPLAVALMPDWKSSSENELPDRLLLNFPAKLETDWIATALGKSSRWANQFNGTKDNLLHLHWPSTKKALKKPWWKNTDIIKNGFTLTSIDLGLKTAAAFTVLHVVNSLNLVPENKRRFSRHIGTTGNHQWYAYPTRRGTLRLPGEGSKVLRPANPNSNDKSCAFLPEFGGIKGRLASTEETQEYLDFIAHTACAAEWLQKKAKENTPLHFPEQNDDLLKLAKQIQNNLSNLHRILQLARDPEINERDPSDLNDRQKERLTAALNYQTKEQQDALSAKIRKEQKDLREFLITLTARILPLRKYDWDIVEQAPTTITNSEGEEVKFTPHQLIQRPRHESSSAKIKAQRGLSAPRIEQLDDLRRRIVSLQRELNRDAGVEQKIGFGRQSGSIPEPAQEILDKLDNLKEQRVKQTAHLILTQALGLRLTANKVPKSTRLDYVHGEYEKIPGATTSDFIVIEDLMRYRTRSDRSRFENRKLMQWSHRAIAETLKELVEPYGIPVLTTAASFSSRFCSITARPGFRAIEINKNRLDHPAFNRLLNEDASQEEHYLGNEIKRILSENPDKSQLRFLIPMDGGPLFVPTIGKNEERKDFPVSQADINAAHNLGLRAIAAPDKLEHIHKIRAVKTKDTIYPRTENIREKSALDKKHPITPANNNAEFSKEIATKKYTNFFYLGLSPLTVELDAATLETKDGETLQLASSYGTWATVNKLKIPNVTAIFNETLKIKNLTDDIPM
ncbi:MAG: type V CRISPR-associated protein Cas12b [Verrucomicrobiales bacterium]|nr:type V CRISPR-associated protein Cas12b [Verrucomicrobiales bacterium]